MSSVCDFVFPDQSTTGVPTRSSMAEIQSNTLSIPTRLWSRHCDIDEVPRSIRWCLNSNITKAQCFETYGPDTLSPELWDSAFVSISRFAVVLERESVSPFSNPFMMPNVHLWCPFDVQLCCPFMMAVSNPLFCRFAPRALCTLSYLPLFFAANPFIVTLFRLCVAALLLLTQCPFWRSIHLQWTTASLTMHRQWRWRRWRVLRVAVAVVVVVRAVMRCIDLMSKFTVQYLLWIRALDSCSRFMP